MHQRSWRGTPMSVLATSGDVVPSSVFPGSRNQIPASVSQAAQRGRPTILWVEHPKTLLATRRGQRPVLWVKHAKYLQQLILRTPSQIYMFCIYEHLWPVNRTHRFAANSTTTVCNLWQLLICVHLHLKRSTETTKYCTNEGGVKPDVRSSTSGDILPSKVFSVLGIKYQLQFHKQREEGGDLCCEWSIPWPCYNYFYLPPAKYLFLHIGVPMANK